MAIGLVEHVSGLEAELSVRSRGHALAVDGIGRIIRHADPALLLELANHANVTTKGARHDIIGLGLHLLDLVLFCGK